MFLDEIDRQFLEVWIKHSAAMKLVTAINGRILWANDEFLEWCGYTLNELQKMTWVQLSVPDDNSEADIATAMTLDEYNLRYSVKKQYIPKNERPVWGTLTVMRFPPAGEIKYCGCTWEPLRNGTATAFHTAMERYEMIQKELKSMTSTLEQLSKQTEEDKWIVSTVAMIRKYPKLAVTFLVIAFSIMGVNNIVELLQRTGIIPVPTLPIVPLKEGAQLESTYPADGTQMAVFREIADDEEKTIKALTPDGWIITWSYSNDGTRTLHNIHRQPETEVDRSGLSDQSSDRGNGGRVEVSGGKPASTAGNAFGNVYGSAPAASEEKVF